MNIAGTIIVAVGAVLIIMALKNTQGVLFPSLFPSGSGTSGTGTGTSPAAPGNVPGASPGTTPSPCQSLICLLTAPQFPNSTSSAQNVQVN